MAVEYRSLCKDCGAEFGYSEASVVAGAIRGLSRPERCPACRRTHARESRQIGIPQVPLKPRGTRQPDSEISAGRLGKIAHPERFHRKVVVESRFRQPGTLIDFGITDDDIRRLTDALRVHQVAVVVGPTGSGKSTFLPYRLMCPPEGVEQDVFTRHGQIVVTQPRIQATRNIARFVACDLHGAGLGAGFDVGFRHSNAPAADWRNKLVFITDGTLINWIVSGQIANLGVIMIDEAHERSLNIDIILGLLKQQLPRFPRLKLIIASATIDARLFQDFYGGPDQVALLEFKGLKQCGVETFFPPHDTRYENGRHVPGLMAAKVLDLLKAIAGGKKSEGDILGFLPGEREIETCVAVVREGIARDPKLCRREISVHPLYTRLPQATQDVALQRKTLAIRDRVVAVLANEPGLDRILVLSQDRASCVEAAGQLEAPLQSQAGQPWTLSVAEEGTPPVLVPRQIVFATHEAHLPGMDEYRQIADRRVVISTNVAETSLTVDGVVYVVDSGLLKQSHWEAESTASDLPTIFHSRAGCRQRWGRAGRVRDGEAHCLYTDDQFEALPAHTTPEIQRASLDQVVLRAKSAGIRDIAQFPWIQPPPIEELSRAPRVLAGLGALDGDGDLTDLGLELESLTAEVRVATLLVAADQMACGIEMATLAALSSRRLQGGLLLKDPRWDYETSDAVRAIHARFMAGCRDDLELYLKIYSVWAEAPDAASRTRLCRAFFISEDELETTVAPARQRYLEMLSVGKKTEEDRPVCFALLDRLRVVLASSLPDAFLFRFSGGSISGLQPHGPLPVTVDDSSVVSGRCPSCFAALGRRITTFRSDRELRLSGLVSLDEPWLELRGKSVLEKARVLAELLGPVRRDGIRLAAARMRLFADVRFPVGSRFECDCDGDGRLRPAGGVSLPDALRPTFDDGAVAAASTASAEASGDVSPLAGWHDKADRLVAYAELDAGDAGEDTTADDRRPGDEAAAPPPGGAGVGRVPGLIVRTAEMAAMRRLGDRFRCESPCADRRGCECEVTGHTLESPDGPVVHVVPTSTIAGAGRRHPAAGDVRTVEGIRVKTTAGGGEARSSLVVRESGGSSQEFLVSSHELSFSGRAIVGERLVGQSFELKAVCRGADVRWSRLPFLEDRLGDYLRRSASGPIRCRLVEQVENDLYFTLEELESEGTVELGHLRWNPKWGRSGGFKLGRVYDLTVRPGYGEAQEALPVPPGTLLQWVEEHKTTHQVFWSAPEGRLHVRRPLSSKAREELESLGDDEDYRSAVARLYRHSHKVQLQDPHRRPTRRPMVQDAVPDYQPGERVHGRVVKLLSDGCLIELEKGGTGKAQIRHLAWVSAGIIDPREVVADHQEVEPRVIWCRSGEHGRILIALSLLDEKDFPATWAQGTIHTARITKVDERFALGELVPGLTGKIDISQSGFGPVSHMRERVTVGDAVQVKVLRVRLDPLVAHPGDRAVRIALTLRVNEMMETVAVPPSLIGLVIGHRGCTIKEMQEQIRCDIVADDGSVTITSDSQERIDQARRSIEQILEPHRRAAARAAAQAHQQRGPQHRQVETTSLRIPRGRIGRLVGRGGATINAIKAESACSVWFDQDGVVKITTRQGRDALEKAVRLIRDLIPETIV